MILGTEEKIIFEKTIDNKDRNIENDFFLRPQNHFQKEKDGIV